MAEFVRLEHDGEPISADSAIRRLDARIEDLQKNEEVLRHSLARLLMERDLIKALVHHGVIAG